MKCYISGKITGLEFSSVIKTFENAEWQLRHRWYEPVNPITKGLQKGNNWFVDILLKYIPWYAYMAYDLYLLSKCDYIYMINGWETSRGARIERRFAKLIGIKHV